MGFDNIIQLAKYIGILINDDQDWNEFDTIDSLTDFEDCLANMELHFEKQMESETIMSEKVCLSCLFQNLAGRQTNIVDTHLQIKYL